MRKMLVHRAPDERGVGGGAASVLPAYFAWFDFVEMKYNLNSLKYGW